MKYLQLISVLLLVIPCYSQNVVRTITINPGEKSVTTSLPFDRPIILKWISKEPVIITYAGLVTIRKGNVSAYYKNWAQNRSFLALDAKEGNMGNAESRVHVEELQTTSTMNTDGKYESNIMIAPLKPNRFYDVKILRRPVDIETSLYFDLFLSIGNRPVFDKKLTYINNLKAPFKHVYFSGPHVGTLMFNELNEFYSVFLKSYYDDITNAGGDKDKIAVATAKIKATIVNDAPPNAFNVTGGYIEIFEAIESGDSARVCANICALAIMLKGYVPSMANCVGDYNSTRLDSLYRATPQLKGLIAKYAAATDQEKENIQGEIMNEILDKDLPTAEDMFIFGQTLSATTAVLDFDTRTNFTITPDFGYVYYGAGQSGFHGLLPYIGFQLEFRYFDKNIPFNLIHPKSLLHYLSFTTGLSLTSLKTDGKRDDFFSNKSLLIGLGFRLSSATRMTFGSILFRKEDPNPLIDNKKLAATPFIGLSIDLKLKSILNDFVGLISTKKP